MDDSSTALFWGGDTRAVLRLYVDSEEDTGSTRLPLLSRAHGSTGESGSPAWEALDSGQSLSLYALPRCEVVDRKNLSAVLTISSGLTRAMLSGVLAAGLVILPKPSVRFADEMVGPFQVVQAPSPVQGQISVGIAAEPLPEVLQAMRAQAGLPVGDLAGLLGVKRRQFYNWLSEENSPDPGAETRIRQVAELIEGLFAQLGSGKQVRAALLTPVEGRTAYRLISDERVDEAAEQLGSLDLGSLAPRPLGSRVKRTSENTLLQLQYLRHSLPGEDD